MAIAAKFVFYPIHGDDVRTDTRLTNWAIMADLGDRRPPPRREDWNCLGRPEEALPFVRDSFRLGFLDPLALVEATRLSTNIPIAIAIRCRAGRSAA